VLPTFKMDHVMSKKLIVIFSLIIMLNGCASSAELKKRSQNNTKAGDYYESIGQPEAARQEHEMARDNRNRSFSIETILYDILFGDDDN
jgi:hypothetical protein